MGILWSHHNDNLFHHLSVKPYLPYFRNNSYATCLAVHESPPMVEECAQPLRTVSEQIQLRPFFSCILSEFRDASVPWQEVIAYDELPKGSTRNPLKLEIYVWPLQI